MKYKLLFSFLLLSLSACMGSYEVVDETKNLVTIPLELTTHLGDRQEFIHGEEIQFLLSLGSDAYIYMYYLDAEKNITQILPNTSQRSHYYTVGYFLTIPEYENGYRFIVDEPFGKEEIWIMASDQSMAINVSEQTIEKIKQQIKINSQREYGEYVFNFITTP